MGKRRSRKAPPKKATVKLPTSFDCPFCNHGGTVVVKLGKIAQVGCLECRICGVKSETRITHLTKEIDVYCEWMDSCAEANKDDEHGLSDLEDDAEELKRRKVVCVPSDYYLFRLMFNKIINQQDAPAAIASFLEEAGSEASYGYGGLVDSPVCNILH